MKQNVSKAGSPLKEYKGSLLRDLKEENNKNQNKTSGTLLLPPLLLPFLTENIRRQHLELSTSVPPLK